MITLLILIGLTFYQNLHTYHSDVIKYETANNYLTCSDLNDNCPKPTQKTLKDVKKEKNNVQSQKPQAKQNPKLSIPIEEINAALNGIKTPDIFAIKTEIAAFHEEGNRSNGIEMSAERDKHESVTDASGISLENLLTPAPHKETTDKLFAINPTAQYAPENEKIIEAKIQDFDKEMTENNPSVISTEEIRFTSDENQISIDQSSIEIINRMNQKYRNHKIRVSGFGIDENDAVNMTLMVLEVIDQGIILDEVRAVSDKNKRMVLIEVLNEI